MKPNSIVSKARKKLRELNLNISISLNSSEGLCVDQDLEGFYHFKYVERGSISTDAKTKDPNDVLYWLYQSATFEDACQFELLHRTGGEDFRRVLFEKQLSLLKRIGIEYYERRNREISEILQKHPYNDSI